MPDTGSTWFLPRLVGHARAAEMIFTADPVDAATAERIGLVNRVVAGRPADGRGAVLWRRGWRRPRPWRWRWRSARLNRALDTTSSSALDYEAQLQAIAGRSADHKEGVAAFVEKRRRRFTGE